MSEKKLKQTRLPFQILTSPKTPTPTSAPKSIEKSSSPSTPKTPKPIASRKRKPSSEGENLRSTKIGRLTNAKENIAEPETIELIDSDDDEKKQNVTKTLQNVETTPTTTSITPESVIHIKLPSTTKSRRKQELKATKSVEEIEDDDSVVYLDNEELPSKSNKKVKRSAKKSENKKKKGDSSDEGIERVKKTLELNESAEAPSSDEDDEKEAPKTIENDPVDETPSKLKKISKVVEEPMEVDDEPQPAESTVSDQISKLIDASGVSSSPVKDIKDILSDDEIETSPNDQSLNTSLNTSLNQSVDNNKTPKPLTPKMLARRKEFEEKRLEKELQKKKEREAKELQRLKEKEQREEAKRREKEEKEELRRKEKEEKEVK